MQAVYLKTGFSRLVLQAGAGSADVDLSLLDPSRGVYTYDSTTPSFTGARGAVVNKAQNKARAAIGFIAWVTGNMLIEQDNGERVFLTGVIAGMFYQMSVKKILHSAKLVDAYTGTESGALTTTVTNVQAFWEP